MNAVLDWLACAFAILFAPVLKLLARRRHTLPRFQAMSDRIGVQLRSTHYYEPTYRAADLPADTQRERNLPGIRLDAAPQLALISALRYGAELEAFPLTPPGTAALQMGGVCDGPPGLRPLYGPRDYGAFVRDLDGNKIEAMFRDGSAPTSSS